MAKITNTTKRTKIVPQHKTSTLITVEHKPYPQAINTRFLQLRFNMEENQVDAVYLSHLPNIRYLTNYSGSCGVMLVTKDEIHFFTDDRYEEQVKTELYDLYFLRVHITRDVWKCIEEEGLLNDVKCFGVESDHISFCEAAEIRAQVHNHKIKFKPIANLVEKFTQPKTSEEVENIQQSCNIAEKVFEHILSFIKPGKTELDIAIEIDYKARLLGSEGIAFDTIVTSGARGALVHGQPSDKKIKKGDVILMDFGCKVNGFCSDITRTICVGKPTKEQKDIYSLIYTAMNEAIEKVRPAMRGNYLDAIARDIIIEAGYGDYFKHSLGHGLGLVCHEKPTITFRIQNQIIPENVVLAIEPGIYIPDKFGMRVEDDVFVGKGKNRRLTNAPSELIGI